MVVAPGNIVHLCRCSFVAMAELKDIQEKSIFKDRKQTLGGCKDGTNKTCFSR